jgi:Recombinase
MAIGETVIADISYGERFRELKANADRDAAKVIPIIREMQRAGVTSLTQIADALNARGISTPRGTKWRENTVANVLGRDVRRDERETRVLSFVPPENGPPWVAEFLELLRGGWDPQAACDHVRRKRVTVNGTFARLGLPSPFDYAQAVRHARFAALADAGYSDIDIAEKCGCKVITVWEWRVLREGRGEKVEPKSLEEKKKKAFSIRLKTGKTREKQLNLL